MAVMKQTVQDSGDISDVPRPGRAPGGRQAIHPDVDSSPLQTVVAGVFGGVSPMQFVSGIDAAHQALGNRAFVNWVGALQSVGREAAAAGMAPPLQLMGKKKKKPGASPASAGAGSTGNMEDHAGAGKTGSAGAGQDEEAVPEPIPAQPEVPGSLPMEQPGQGEGAAGEAKKKKKKSRVQVALNTLRGEGMAAFGAYIETAIGEEELLRTLVERIMRAEDLGGVRTEALGVVEGRLRLLDPEGVAGVAGTATSAQRQEPEMADMAPVKSELNRREKELFDACFKNEIGRFKRLLGHRNVDVNVGSKYGTLLSLAVFRGHTTIVSVLLSRPDIDVNLVSGEGKTATSLYLAVQERRVEIVKLLLAKPGTKVNLVTESTPTPLSLAVLLGHVDTVKLLLTGSNIDVNVRGKQGASPLFFAAQQGYLEIVELLLAVPGIDINLATFDGTTPLCIATCKGNEEVVKLLLAAPDININARLNTGATILSLAAQNGRSRITELLIEHGADVNLAKDDGSTPLTFSANYGYVDVVRTLLRVPGVEVNSRTNNGVTPLLFAVKLGYKDIVNLLLDNGAEPNIKNNAGINALLLACFHGRAEIVHMLLRAGADPDVVVNDPVNKGRKQTPYSMAELAGHREVMSILALHPRRREAVPPRLKRLSLKEEAGKTAPPLVSPEAVSPPGATAGKQGVRTYPELRESAVAGEQGAAGQATARVSPLPAPSPPVEAMTDTEPPTPLAQAKDALRQEVLGKCLADNLDEHKGMELLMAVNATTDMDGLCTLYNRLAHIERREERSRRRRRRREVLSVPVGPGPAAAGPEAASMFDLDEKTGLDADAVEDEIKRCLAPKYQRFVSQAVNDMEFGRGKPTTGYAGLWHASAGIPGVGSCSVFYYLDAERNRIRIEGIGHHVGRAAYRLDYASAELGEAGRILRIA